MKNITYSQYKREVAKQDHFPVSEASEQSFTSSVPDDQLTLGEKMQILSRELKGFEIRERLLKATNDSLSRTINSLKVSKDCRHILEDCLQELKRIRQHIYMDSTDMVKQQYECMVEQMREGFEEEKTKMQDSFLKQIQNIRVEIRKEMQQQLKAESAELEEKIRVSQLPDKTKHQSKARKEIKMGLGLLSPKQLDFDTVLKSTTNKVQPVTTLTSASNTQSIKSHRNENMPRLANIELVKSPNRQNINSSSSRLSLSKNSRHVRRNSAIQMSFAGQKNVATDLLCDICGKSYSPIEFFSHVDNCKKNRDQASRKSIKKIVEISNVQESDEEEVDNENLQALEMLLKKKEEIEYRIEMLRYNKEGSQSEKERLETDLDHIVYVIKNKANMKEQLKKLVQRKEVDNISIIKVRLGEQSKSSARLSLGNNMFAKKPSSIIRKQIKASRNVKK